MCVPIAERREVRFDGRKTLNLQVFNGPLPLPLGPSFPLCLLPSLLLFTIDPPPTLHTEYSTKQSDGGRDEQARFSIDFLIYSALRKERSVSSFQGRGREKGALATPPSWPTPLRPPRMEDTHPLLKYALCRTPNERANEHERGACFDNYSEIPLTLSLFSPSLPQLCSLFVTAAPTDEWRESRDLARRKQL